MEEPLKKDYLQGLKVFGLDDGVLGFQGSTGVHLAKDRFVKSLGAKK